MAIAYAFLLAATFASGSPIVNHKSSLVSPADDPKITYEARGLFAKNALEEIGKLAGTNLRTTVATGQEILILHVENMPLSELKAKIAQATSAEWQQEADGSRLVRTNKLRQELERTHHKYKAEQARAAQEALRATLVKQGAFDDSKAKQLGLELEVYVQGGSDTNNPRGNYAKSEAIRGRLPVARLASALACTLDPEALASMEPRDRIVFSTAPTRVQRPLPKAAWAAIEGFAGEQALFKKYLQAIALPTSYSYDYGIYQSIGRAQKSGGTPAKVLVGVTSRSGTWNLDVKVADEKGRVIAQTGQSLQPPNSSFASLSNPTPTSEPPIELSPPSKELAEALIKAIRGGGAPEMFPKLSKTLLDTILHPEEHDLAEFVASDVLIGVGKLRNESLIACVPDVFGFFAAAVFAMGNASPTQVLAAVQNGQMGLKVEEAEGTMLVRSQDPYESIRTKVDRKALGVLLRIAAQKETLSIDERAAFVVASELPFDQSVAVPYLMIVSPEAMKGFNYDGGDLLRLHGLLTMGQRQALAGGDKIPLSRLSPSQRDLVEKMVYGRIPGFGAAYGVPMPVSFDEDGPYETIANEPTEKFGNGLPPGAALSANIHSSLTIFYSGTRDTYRTSGKASVESLAYSLLSKEMGRSGDSFDILENAEYRSGTTTTIEYTLFMEQGFSFRGTLEEVGPLSPRVDRPDKLPAEVWDQIQKKLAALREAEKNRKPPP